MASIQPQIVSVDGVPIEVDARDLASKDFDGANLTRADLKGWNLEGRTLQMRC